MHSKLQNLDAIVLGSTSYGDSDKIVTFFTKEKGKLRGIAKGVKKITSKKRPSLEPFTYITLQITKGNLGIISEVKAKNNFTNIRLDLKTIAVSYFLCECVNKSFADESPHSSVFSLLLSSLNALNSGANKTQVKNKFANELLFELGYTEHIGTADPTSELEDIIERKLGSVRIGRMLQ